MLGISLSFYKQELKRVPVHLNRKPVKTLDVKSLLKPELQKVADNLEYYFGTDNSPDNVHRLPFYAFSNPTVDHLAKIRVSSIVMMDESVEKVFEENPNYEIIRKITSSMWRYGHIREQWNEIVNAYNLIRAFRFDKEGFTVRLDHTTYHNEKGMSKYTRTYLDGVFAYLLYYKGKHVMTLGFSLMAGRRILIQQIQLKNPKGNRWLFKLPANYVEYMLELFQQNFPRHKLYLVDGETAARQYLGYYKSSLDNAREKFDKYRSDPKRYDYYKSQEEYVLLYEKAVSHAQKEILRLKTLYNNTGSFIRQKESKTYNDIRHDLIKKEM